MKSFEAGSDGDPSPLLGEILIALSAGQGLRGKLLARLRQCLTRTALKPVLSLNESPEWPEMTALIRLDLPLSFDVKPHVYLPELCHIIVSLCCTGSLPMRRSVHALLLNTIHGLAKDVDIEENTLRATLEGLSGDKGRSIFGLDPLLPDFDVLSDGEVLVRALVQVIEVAAPYVGAPISPRKSTTAELLLPRHGQRLASAVDQLGDGRLLPAQPRSPSSTVPRSLLPWCFSDRWRSGLSGASNTARARLR